MALEQTEADWALCAAQVDAIIDCQRGLAGENAGGQPPGQP